MIKFTGDKKLLIQLNYEFNPETYYREKVLVNKKTKIKVSCFIGDDLTISFIGDFKYHKIFLDELGSDNYVFL